MNGVPEAVRPGTAAKGEETVSCRFSKHKSTQNSTPVRKGLEPEATQNVKPMPCKVLRLSLLKNVRFFLLIYSVDDRNLRYIECVSVRHTLSCKNAQEKRGLRIECASVVDLYKLISVGRRGICFWSFVLNDRAMRDLKL